MENLYAFNQFQTQPYYNAEINPGYEAGLNKIILKYALLDTLTEEERTQYDAAKLLLKAYKQAVEREDEKLKVVREQQMKLQAQQQQQLPPQELPRRTVDLGAAPALPPVDELPPIKY